MKKVEQDETPISKNIEYIGEIQSDLALEQLAVGFAWNSTKRFGEVFEKLESIKKIIG